MRRHRRVTINAVLLDRITQLPNRCHVGCMKLTERLQDVAECIPCSLRC